MHRYGKNFLIIGAGISGLTLARLFADRKIPVKVYDSRSFIGGNCHCHYENNIEIQEYGPHIFHTDNEEVWNFIRRFTDFNQFQLNVISHTDKGNFFLPFGLSLLNSFFGVSLSPNEMSEFLRSKQEKISNPKNLEEKALSLVGKEIYETFIKGYTLKQWKTNPKDLPSEIITRLPFRQTYDVNYYNDLHFGIPLDGYNELFNRLVNYPLISIELNHNWTLEEYDPSALIFFTGQIDRLFNYRFGVLPYRSLKFEFETYDCDNFLGNSVINYPSEEVPYTRKYEFRWFHPEIKSYSEKKTIVCTEYPQDYSMENEPYYPIDTEENRQLYDKYLNFSQKNYPNIIYCGRLAQYKYFDMDDALRNAFGIFSSIFNHDLCK